MKIDLLRFIPPAAAKVLEVGCGDGSLGKRYKQLNPACLYIGMEKEIELAVQARNYIDGAYAVNVNCIELPQVGIFAQELDCIVYGDILQQLASPAQLLQSHSRYVREGGQLLCFLENKRYISKLLGKQDKLKLFEDDEAVLAGIREAGFSVYEVIPCYHRQDQERRSNNQLNEALCVLREHYEGIAADPWVYGYVVRAVKGLMPKPLLLQTIMGETKVCSRVRITEPHAFCNSIPGVRVISTSSNVDLSVGRPGEDKVFIRQRISLELPIAAEQQKVLMALGYLTIAEMDDDPLRWEERHRKNNFFSFRGCHGVQVSTPALAEYMKQFNPNVAVFANQLAYLPEPRVYDDAQPVTIVFGALNREDDWRPIMPVLNRVLMKYDSRVRVLVIFDRLFFDALNTKHKQFIPLCAYPVYEQILHASDIAILPLENNRFNSMKSDLKFIECAGHGVAVLASPTVYAASVRHGRTGYIYHKPKEFEQHLTALIEDTALRHELAGEAYAYVREHRLLAQHYQARYEWYKGLLERLPELNRELVGRNSELR